MTRILRDFWEQQGTSLKVPWEITSIKARAWTWKLELILYSKKYLMSRFNVPSSVLGTHIQRKDESVFIPQLPFILNLLQSNFYLLPRCIRSTLGDVTNVFHIAKYNALFSILNRLSLLWVFEITNYYFV